MRGAAPRKSDQGIFGLMHAYRGRRDSPVSDAAVRHSCRRSIESRWRYAAATVLMSSSARLATLKKAAFSGYGFGTRHRHDQFARAAAPSAGSP